MKLMMVVVSQFFAAALFAVTVSTDTTYTALDIESLADSVEIAEGKTLTLSVDSGEVTLSQKVSGAGMLRFTGAGTLNLAGFNDFSGGLIHAGEGMVRGSVATAFGAGTVYLSCDKGSLVLSSPGATFANEISISARAFLVFEGSSGTTTISGDITSTSDFYIVASAGGNNEFTGRINAYGCNVIKARQTYAGVYLRAPVTCETFRGAVNNGTDNTDGAGWGYGNVFFCATNSISRLSPAGGEFFLCCPDGFAGEIILTDNYLRNNGYHISSKFNLNGYDLNVSVLDTYYLDGGYTIAEDTTGVVTSPKPAELTVTGAGSYLSNICLQDKASFNWSPPDDESRLTLPNRTHTTAGTLTVSRGTVAVTGSATFASLTGIVLKSGAALELESAAAASLTSVELFEIAGDAALHLSPGASVSVAKAFVGGVPLMPGVYTPATAAWLKGESITFEVRQSVWTARNVEALDGAGISIPAGKKVVFETSDGAAYEVPNVISGAGAVEITGDGEITLSAANTFSGGITMTGTGSLIGTNAAAFGSGTVSLSSTGSICFGLKGAVFPNDIVVSAKGRLLFGAETVTIDGDISATSDFYFGEVDNPGGPYVFNGKIAAEGCSIVKIVEKKSAWHFNGGIQAAVFRSSAALNHGDYGFGWGSGYFHFNASNDIGIVSLAGSELHVNSVEGLGADTVITDNYLRDNGYHNKSYYHFNVGDIEVHSVPAQLTGGYATGVSSDTCRLGSADPAVLTVSGGGTYASEALLMGSLSLCWNPPDDSSVITVSNRAHTTSGAIEVRRGAFVAAGKSSFVNLGELKIGAGAVFRLDSSLSGAFASLSRIFIAEGGTLEIVSGSDPFTAGMTGLVLAEGAKVKLAEGINAGFSFVAVQGSLVENGTYLSSSVDWLEGDGTIGVKAGADVLWKNAEDGNWAVAANWSTLSVPDADAQAIFTLAGDSYTVTVDSDAGSLGALKVGHFTSGERVTLSVKAPVGLESDGKIDVMQGGVVKLSAGGSLCIAPGTSAQQGADRLLLRDGGELDIDGGLLCATNVYGSITVADQGRFAASAGSATVGFAAAGSNFIVDNGGSMELSGDAGLRLNVPGFNHEVLVVKNGGLIDVSGNASIGPVEKGLNGAFKVFGEGTVNFRENSVFGNEAADLGPSGLGWSIAFSSGSAGTTGVVSFTDHALLNDQSSSFRIDRGTDRTMRINLASDASHNLRYCTYVGAGDGCGELDISAGYALQGGMGMRIPGLYQKQGVLSALESEGIVKVSGGALFVNASVNAANERFSGIIIGDWTAVSLNPSTGVFNGDVLRGVLEISGDGIVTNGVNSDFVVGGCGPGTFARLLQSGGRLVNLCARADVPTVVALGGAKGEWIMTGGEAELAGSLYVGGCSLEASGRSPMPTEDASPKIYPGTYYEGLAEGLLEMSGGRLQVGGDLVLAEDGSAVLKLTPQAKLLVEGELDAASEAELVVDIRGYDGPSIRVAAFGGTRNAFSDENISLLEDSGSGYSIDIGETYIRIRRRASSVIMIVR